MIRPLRRVLSLTRGRNRSDETRGSSRRGSRHAPPGSSGDDNPQRRIDEARRRLKATIPSPPDSA